MGNFNRWTVRLASFLPPERDVSVSMFRKPLGNVHVDFHKVANSVDSHLSMASMASIISRSTVIHSVGP